MKKFKRSNVSYSEETSGGWVENTPHCDMVNMSLANLSESAPLVL